MNKIICTCFCWLLTCACVFPALSQKQPIIGLNLNSHYYSDNIRPSFGLTLETRLTKHSGIESGIFYRTDRFHTIFLRVDSVGPGIYPITVSTRFINIPLLYKYYSKRLNVSVGPLLDFYTGWKQKSSQILLSDFTIHPTIRVGFLGKVSKTFIVSKQIILEPELRVGFLRNSNELGAGAGIAAKYQF